MTTSSPTEEVMGVGEANHGERLHSLCSASGAERWLNCPGSVGLSRGLPNESGPSALQGTRAHELSEKILREWIAKNRTGLEVAFVDALRPQYEDTVDEKTGLSMVDHALVYVFACIEEVNAFDPGTDVAVRVEHRLTFNADMNMFGTADFFATGVRGGKGYGVIVDLKYGTHAVKVENNPQLGQYGVSLKKMSKRNLEYVKVRVVQPRIKKQSSEIEYNAQELRDWNKKLTLGAEKALIQIGSKNPTLKAGSWCFFCPASKAGVCPEQRRVRAEKAVEMFDEITEEVAA
jgi:hypothetical protein